jgi:probable phosphoglycerate mutase
VGVATLILIRHGETIANAEERFTTGSHEPLSAYGEAQADAAGRGVAAHFAPVALYTSPYWRSRQTAQRIAAHLALEPVVVAELREQSCGELHGRPYSEYTGDPGVRGVARWTHRPPGGETLREVARRAGPALDRIAARHARQVVVVVSHGGVMAALRGYTCCGFKVPPVPTGNAAGFLLEHEAGAYAGPFDLPAFPEVGREVAF